MARERSSGLAESEAEKTIRGGFTMVDALGLRRLRVPAGLFQICLWLQMFARLNSNGPYNFGRQLAVGSVSMRTHPTASPLTLIQSADARG